MSRFLPALVLILPLLSATKASALEVVASIRPLALIADAVMAGHGEARQLVPDGASSHEYALRPSDRALLARADLVVWVGPVHEHFLPGALRNRPVLTAQKLPGLKRLPVRRLSDGASVAGSLDPHVWLSPDNAVVIARALAVELGRRDKAGAAAYTANAEAFARRVQLQNATLQQRFLPLRAQPLLAYHDAYHYLDDALGLRFRGSLTLEPEHKPGAQHVLAMARRVQKEKIACLLTEPGADAALATRIFGQQPYRMAGVDELFVGVPRGASGYETGLARMADEIYRCLAAGK